MTTLRGIIITHHTEQQIEAQRLKSLPKAQSLQVTAPTFIPMVLNNLHPICYTALLPGCSGAGGLEVMLRRGQGPSPCLMATAQCLYSHLLSAGWSKLKPFPGRHPAPAAACGSEGEKGQGYLLWESTSRWSWVK